MELYLGGFGFPSEKAEIDFLFSEHTPSMTLKEEWDFWRVHTHKESFYPFNVLSRYRLNSLDFEPVTILFGDNGCGKTTALNIIADKLKLSRKTLFNKGRFWDDYLEHCYFIAKEDEDERPIMIPTGSKIIVSDDIFKETLSRREYNTALIRIKHLKRKSTVR